MTLVHPAALSALVPTAELRGVAEVVAASRFGCYLRLPGATGPARILPLLAGDAAALPTAARLALPSTRLHLGVTPGTRVGVHPDGVDLPAGRVAFVRRWTPARVSPRPSTPAHPRPLWVGRPDADRAPLVDRLTEVVETALERRPLERPVAALVGLGPGSTPTGDDLLAGALLTLRAADIDTGLGAAVAGLADRTTELSASLLRAAAQGYAVPELCALVTAAVAGNDDRAATAARAVTRLGHWSGADLVAGVAATLAVLAARQDAATPMNSRPLSHRSAS